jgi:hypothetical protein
MSARRRPVAGAPMRETSTSMGMRGTGVKLTMAALLAAAAGG